MTDPLKQLAGHTRRSFLIGGVAASATIGAYEWLAHAQQVGQLQSPLRRAEQFNAALSRALFAGRQLAPTYPAARATELRLNGDLGQDPNMLLDSWRLQVVGLENPRQYKQFIEDVDLWQYQSGNPPEQSAPPLPSDPKRANDSVQVEQTITVTIPAAPASDTDRTPGIVLSLADLRALPYHEQITQFKCIEGWSQITSFGGVRFRDFLNALPTPAPAKQQPAPLRHHGDGRRHLLLQLRHRESASSPNPALLPHERQTPYPGPRRTPASGHAIQIRIQAD